MAADIDAGNYVCTEARGGLVILGRYEGVTDAGLIVTTAVVKPVISRAQLKSPHTQHVRTKRSPQENQHRKIQSLLFAAGYYTDLQLLM